jgi:hypothetical protein
MYAFQEPQAPLFPFSAGIIPHTRFVFSRLHAHYLHSNESGSVDSVVNVSVVVKNEGKAGGSALVALYYSPPVVPLVLRYARRLVGFKRIYVPSRGSSRVFLQVHVARDLSRYDAERQRYVVDAGLYLLIISCAFN